MAIQLSETVRNARLDAIETTIGTDAKLYIRTGSPPAGCSSGDSGTLLATITCPTDWLNAAGSGQKTLKGSWTVAASDSGVAGHFRVKDSTGTTCHIQGNITATGNGGSMTVDNTSISVGQTITIVTFTMTDGNA